MKRLITLLVFTYLTCSLLGQEKIIFHKFGSTASSWEILEWNISDTSNSRGILKETIDRNSRVIELEFLNVKAHLCYLATRIKYSYYENKIIEDLFFDSIPLIANECEMNYRSIYHLKDNYIEKVETFFRFDTINYSAREIEEIKKYIQEHKMSICDDSTNTEIEYYYHSYAKLNGIYPVNKGYKFEKGHYYYDKEPVNKSIIDGIEKLRKNNR